MAKTLSHIKMHYAESELNYMYVCAGVVMTVVIVCLSSRHDFFLNENIDHNV